MERCPCGSGQAYAECCGRYIDEQAFPSTPEELMRSRYTAYTRLNMAYLAATVKPPAADHFNAGEALEWARQVKWLRLEVLSSQAEADQGTVEFKAHYSDQGQELCLHERSAFRREGRQWYYCDGTTPSGQRLSPRVSSKIPRNDPCPCGSQKKYKKCCGA